MGERQVLRTISHKSASTSLWLHCAASLDNARRRWPFGAKRKDRADDACLPFGRSSTGRCLHVSAPGQKGTRFRRANDRALPSRACITGYTRVGRARGAFFRLVRDGISCTWSGHVGVVPTFFWAPLACSTTSLLMNFFARSPWPKRPKPLDSCSLPAATACSGSLLLKARCWLVSRFNHGMIEFFGRQWFMEVFGVYNTSWMKVGSRDGTNEESYSGVKLVLEEQQSEIIELKKLRIEISITAKTI